MIIFTASDSSEGEEESLDPSKDTAPLIVPAHCVPPGDRRGLGGSRRVTQPLAKGVTFLESDCRYQFR